MFILYANKNRLAVRKSEIITSGSVNVYDIRFGFSEDWDGLSKTAVFRSGQKTVSVLLSETGACSIPWEVLSKPDLHLEAGVYGTKGEDIVLPTVWADLGAIKPGVIPGDEARPPTPDRWEQELAKKGDALGYTEDGKLGLYAGEKLLSAVVVSGGGEGGTTDHRYLTNRDAEKQHPIPAIDGLEEELRRIPAPVEPLTNEDLEEMLK